MIGSLNMGFAVVTHINMVKSEKMWEPYRSFVNTIRDIDHLYAFVTGSLSILVCVDGAHICNQIVVPGWTVSFVDDPQIGIVIAEKGGEGRMAVSRQMIGRLFFEFMSLEWFAAHECASMENLIKTMKVQVPSVLDARYGAISEAVDAMPKLVERG
jgi:hypothetical protein